MRKNREIKLIFALIAVFFAGFLAVPMISVVMKSFTGNGEAASLAHYVEVLTGRGFLRALGHSMVISVCSALITTVLAFILFDVLRNYFYNKKVRKEIEKRCGFKVRLTNDANAAALGEAKFGAGSKYKNSVLITLGTGVGGGIVIDDFSAAIKDVVAGGSLKMTNREAQAIVQDYFARQEEKLSAERAEKGKAAREAGEKYLAENAARDGVVVLPSGLQYKVIKEGTGRRPKATDSVKCHYEGFLTDGTLVDSSLQRGEPAVFGLQQVIAGWTEGLQLMQEGAKYRFFIPYMLGYGESGAGQSIPPYSALVFDVELIKVM